MKKIKSVKLKSFPNLNLERKEGESGKIFWKSCLETVVLREERLEDFKDSLEIEYEEERKYIDVRIEYYNDRILGDFDLSYFDSFSNFINLKCSTERKVEVTVLGRGTL